MRNPTIAAILLAAVVGAPGAAMAQPAGPQIIRAPEKLTVMQFNIAGNNNTFGNSAARIKKSADGLLELVKKNKPSVVTLQEYCGSANDHLKKKLAKLHYKVAFNAVVRPNGSPKSCTNSKYAGNGIVYRDNLGLDSYEWEKALDPRSVNRLEIREVVCLRRTKGVKLAVCTTHLDHKNKKQREKETATLRSSLNATFISKGYRVILGGDFNAKPNANSLDNLYLSGYGQGGKGNFMEATCGKAIDKTCRSKAPKVPTIKDRKIDYIFVTSNVKVTSSTSAKDIVAQPDAEGKISDHKAIKVNLQL